MRDEAWTATSQIIMFHPEVAALIKKGTLSHCVLIMKGSKITEQYYMFDILEHLQHQMQGGRVLLTCGLIGQVKKVYLSLYVF